MKRHYCYSFLLLGLFQCIAAMDNQSEKQFQLESILKPTSLGPKKHQDDVIVTIIEPKTPDEILKLMALPVSELIINGYFHPMPYGSHTIMNVIQADLMLMKLCRKLKRLEMCVLGWSTVPVQLECLENLRSLSLSYNKLREFPFELKALTKLQELELDYNHFTTFPIVIFSFKNLERLDVSHNRLTSLPNHFDELGALEDFDASYNKITIIPKTLLALRSLKNIHFKKNRVDAIVLAKLEDHAAQNNKPEKVYTCVICSKGSEKMKKLLRKFSASEKPQQLVD